MNIVYLVHQTGHKFGCYPTKIEAEKRLEQIKGFREKTRY